MLLPRIMENQKEMKRKPLNRLSGTTRLTVLLSPHTMEANVPAPSSGKFVTKTPPVPARSTCSFAAHMWGLGFRV